MALKFPSYRATLNLNVYEELKRIDREFADILEYLSTEKSLEPEDIIDNADRLAVLARRRRALVEVTTHFKERVWVDAIEAKGFDY